MIEIDKITGRMGNRMFQWAFIYSLFRQGQIPDTYVQDYRYFDKYRNELREIFGQNIGHISKVGIHVRRGDYVNNQFHADLFKTEYYLKAMAQFPDRQFIVITDDKKWCRDNFFNLEVYGGDSELGDFNFLASCDGVIMANSSFSWWAAYLSTGKVVAPKEDSWYNDKQIRCKLLPEWTQV